MSKVPTREQFKEATEAFGKISQICKQFPKRFYPTASGEFLGKPYHGEAPLGSLPKDEVVSAALAQYAMWDRELRPMLEQIAVFQWLLSERAYQEAFAVLAKKKAFKAGGSEKRAAAIADGYEALFQPRSEEELERSFYRLLGMGLYVDGTTWDSVREQQLERERLPETSQRACHDYLKRSLAHDPYSWLEGIVSALDRYYDESSLDEATKHKLHDKGQAALAEIERLLADVKSASTALNDEREGHIELMLRRVRQQQYSLSRALARAMPVGKRDKTLRERTLVWDLRTHFMRTIGEECAAAICHLLTLPGIENQLDPRTVNRLLSEWRRTKYTGGWLS